MVANASLACGQYYSEWASQYGDRGRWCRPRSARCCLLRLRIQRPLGQPKYQLGRLYTRQASRAIPRQEATIGPTAPPKGDCRAEAGLGRLCPGQDVTRRPHADYVGWTLGRDVRSAQREPAGYSRSTRTLRSANDDERGDGGAWSFWSVA